MLFGLCSAKRGHHAFDAGEQGMMAYPCDDQALLVCYSGHVEMDGSRERGREGERRRE